MTNIETKMTESTLKNKPSISPLHLKYWLFISIIILIAVATDRWSSQPKFTEYLSNAATMTSLMLGLVAILYSFIANNGLAENLGNINVVSEDVKKSKDQIAEYLEKTKAVTDASEKNRIALEHISSTLGENLTSLRVALDVVTAQTGELPSRLEQLESTFTEATKAIGAKPPAPVVPADAQARFWTDAAVKRFLERQPLSANLLSIACILANNSNAELSLADFSAAINTPNLNNYYQGMLVSMHSCQIISRQLVKDKSSVYKISLVDLHLKEIARSYYTGYIERNYTGAEKQTWMTKLTAIEALFP